MIFVAKISYKPKFINLVRGSDCIFFYCFLKIVKQIEKY